MLCVFVVILGAGNSIVTVVGCLLGSALGVVICGVYSSLCERVFFVLLELPGFMLFVVGGVVLFIRFIDFCCWECDC